MSFRSDEKREPILVMGIGNVLLGDEGVGIHAIKSLESNSFPSHVHLLDGGTGGFHLLSLIHDYKTIVLIDATLDGQKPGTVRTLHPRFAKDFPRTLSAHDIGLKDLVESASLLGELPLIYLITVSIEDRQDIGMELSPGISAVIPEIGREVSRILNSLEEK